MVQKSKEYTLNEVRKFYGFTQQQLATFLGISRSTLNMTERGERALKTSAEIKLLRLVRVMISAKTTPKKDHPSLKKIDKKKMGSLAGDAVKKAEYRTRKLAKKIEMVKQKNDHYALLLHALSLLRSGAEKRETVILNLMEADMVSKVNKIKDEHLLGLELQQALLIAEKNFWQKKLKDA